MENKKNNENNNKKSFDLMSTIVSHRRIVTIIFVVLYIVLTFVICKLAPVQNNESHFSLNRIELSAEVSSFFFIVVSSIIAVWQYYISCRNENIKNETERIQKSIDLMGYYKDNILDKTAVVRFIFKKSGITDILNNIDKTNINNFDTYELNRLLTESNIQELKKIEDSNDFL